MPQNSRSAIDQPIVGAYLIGDLEAIVGLEPKTIRYYEREGLLSPKRLGNFRVYGPEDIERLKVVKLLRTFDVPIHEIRDELSRYETIAIGNLPDDIKQATYSKFQSLKLKYKDLEDLCHEYLETAPVT